ncbi:hypothetical protein [Aurantiacibacter suaedae]|uniref:hypothetical protein n=1 Tax=Aurantiacibacter suaedae TaxID=2545755 RepID=UPI0010F4EB4F|nr:hypothetical protein [Aurantiacibacter suaedae]
MRGLADLLGVPRWLVLAAAVAVLVGGSALLVRCHDRGVIDGHEKARSARQARAASEADRTAIANDAQRAQVRAADSHKMREAIDHAEAIDPQAVRQPAGPAVRAAADSLRDRAERSGGTAN